MVGAAFVDGAGVLHQSGGKWLQLTPSQKTISQRRTATKLSKNTKSAFRRIFKIGPFPESGTGRLRRPYKNRGLRAPFFALEMDTCFYPCASLTRNSYAASASPLPRFRPAWSARLCVRLRDVLYACSARRDLSVPSGILASDTGSTPIGNPSLSRILTSSVLQTRYYRDDWAHSLPILPSFTFASK